MKFTNNLQEMQGYGSSELVESLQRKFGTKVLDILSRADSHGHHREYDEACAQQPVFEMPGGDGRG